MKHEVFCVYVKRAGLFSFLRPWVLIGISESDQGYGIGYAVDCAMMWRKTHLMRIRMEPPLPAYFYFVPKRAKLLSQHVVHRPKQDEKC